MSRTPRTEVPTVIDAADMFRQRAAAEHRARLRAHARCVPRDPEVGICYGCHRISALNEQRRCLRCANCRPRR